MLKKLLSACVAFTMLSLGAANLQFYTGGDKPWTQKDEVWTSPDLRSLAAGKPESWLELEVEGPCTVSFKLSMDSDSFQDSVPCNGGWLGLSIYSDEDWFGWSSGSGNYFAENSIKFYESGTHFVRWEISSSGYGDSVYGQDICKVKDVVVTPAPSSILVEFNPNGGSGSVVTKRFSTVDAAYDDIPTPTYYGCEFLGWFTEPIGGYPLYEGSQVRFDDPTTYYAHWSMPLEDALGTAGGAIEVWREEYYYDDEGEMWHGVPGESHDGYGAACVDGTSWQCLYARVSGSGTLSFWWRTLGRSHGASSAEGFGSSISYASTWDPMTGREIVQDGEWQKVTVLVYGAGEHQVQWSGYRCSSSSDESDRGGLLVDDLEFTPAPKTVVVGLDANGGVVDQSSVELETSGTYGSLPVPRRAGWEFDGWFTDPIAGYRAGEDRPVRFDQLTLYAHWSIPLEEATGVSEAGDISLRSDTLSDSDAEAWYGTLDDSHDGYGAAASRGTGYSTLYGSATGRGTVTFWWKTVGDEYVSASCDVDRGGGSTCARPSPDEGATSEAPSIMSITGTEWQKASMEFYLDQDHEFQWSASGKVLVDEIKWIPAVEPMKVRFMTSQYVVYKEQTYNPGDRFGGANCSSLCSRDECVALVADPVRTGYVFGGWYLDPEFVKPLDWYAYVPYTGATAYAKWMRPLAAAKVGDLQFKNVAPLDPILAAIYPTTVWNLLEYTYTTGAEVMQTELGGGDWDGWETTSVSTAEATVGSGFLDVLWSVYPYYSSLTLYVDGKEVATIDPFGEPDSRVRVALGQGMHKVHIEAVGAGAPALVTDVKLTAITPAQTVGEWLGRVRDYHYWTKSNLSSLKTAAAAAQKTGLAESRYKAAIEHALTSLLALGEDPLVASTMKKFGFTLDLEALSANGAFSYAQAPAFNTLVNDVFAKAQPAIEAALSDLESIPSSWNGVVTLAAGDYPIDEDVAIDYGDVLYLRSALKGALGAAYWVKAYNTEFDWKKLESDVHGLKLTTPSSAPTIGSNTGWSEVAVFDLDGLFFPISDETATEKIAGEGVGFRAAWFRNKLYLKIDKSNYALEDGIQSLTVSLGDGALKGKDAHFTLDYFPEGVGTLFGESFPEAADRKWVSFDLEELFPDVEFRETETSWMVAIDLEGTKCAKDTTLRYVRMLQISSAATEYDGDRLVSFVEFELEYDAFSDGVYMAANGQTKMFDKVRDQAALAKSKAHVAAALDLAQSADAFILRERTYGGNCLVNYDDRDEDKLQAMREQVATAKGALDAPQEVDWTKGLDERTVERFGYLDNPIKVNLDALFGGRVTRGLIPNTLYPGEYAPAIDEMPDATMGGLLPEMTRDKWVEYAEAEGLEYRNEEFGLVVPEDPCELTPGEEASIELAVAGCGADAKVTVQSSSLPAGMRYDATKRIISGTPTRPGDYSIAVTVTSGTRTLTKYLAVYVAPFPALVLVVADEDAERAGCTVSGGGNYMSGTKVTLKATAAKGWVFTGWDGLPDSYVGDWRNPSAALVTDAEDREIYASFCRISDDWLDIEDPGTVEYALNEPVADDMTIFDAVHSGSLPTITVKDLPTGLKFDAKTGATSGKPTKEEFKFVTVSAKNAGGYTFTRVLRLSVGGAEEPRKEEAHGYLNLQWLENIEVGYAVDQLVSDGFGATVSGLPTGLKYDSKTGKVTGTPTKPGVYAVKATMKDPDNKSKTLTSEFRSIVQDGGSRYIEVLSEDDGTASGSGVYAAGATFKPTAKAANNFVFSGWVTLDPFDDYGESWPVQQAYGADWRNPSQTWIVNDDLPTLLVAAFVAKNAGICDEGDTFCEIVPCDGEEWTADASEGDVYFNFAVESASLPKITVKGLPSGITFGGEKDCVASYDHSVVWYRLKADSAKPPKPGAYDIEISAENQSKAKAEPVTVRITVPNWTSDYIHVDDRYGDFIPGEEMDPVDLDGALDSWDGANFTVAGLPQGMAWNAKANAQKGIAAHTITGKPTKPGDYTVTFTLKIGSGANAISAQATSTFVVLPYPELEVVLEDAESKAAGCKVTGGGNYPSGSKVTLKATAAKGWVFAGWYGLPDSYVGDWRNPSAAIVTGPENQTISADFLRVKDDWLDIEDPGTVEYALNEPVADDMTIFDAVHSGSLPTITVKDLPTGLKFDAKTGAISGKPTREEFKFVTVSAKNAGGYTFTRVLRMSVGGAEEPRKDEVGDYVDLAWLEAFEVGYAVGQQVSDEYAVTVSGLPTGLKYDSKTGKVTGTPTKPGVYVVKATMKDPYDSRVTLTSEFRSIVQDGGSRYIEVLSEDDGTASGSGVYAAGATFKPTAKAANNFVFSGWMTYDPEDYDGEYPVQQDSWADWRNASQTWIVNDNLPTLLVATFVAKNAGICDEGDTFCEIVPCDGEEWTADASEGDVYFNFAVESASLPKITVRGLPSGITFGGEKDCVASYDDSVVWYRLKADSAKPPKPGVYDVEISAENQSKAKAEPMTVRITVPNWRSDVFSGLEYDAPYQRMVGMNSLYDEGEFDFFVEEGWTVTQSGLPAGMKFTFSKDEALGHISGTPSKAGNYTLILTAKKGSQTEQASVTFVVEAFPEELAGTFNGFVTREDWCDPLTSDGTFTLTSGKDGKISAKASYNGTSVSLTATGWSLGSDGIARVSLEKSTTKSGCKFYETMDLSVDLTQPWNQWQVTGPWWHDYSECAYSDSSAELYVSAQRSPYGKVGTKYENPEAHDVAAALAKFGQMTVDLEESGDGWYEKTCSDCGLGGAKSQLKFAVKDTGVISVTGKLGTVSVSGSTMLTIIEEDCFAGYCIKVGSKNVRIKVLFDESGISQCDASIEDVSRN